MSKILTGWANIMAFSLTDSGVVNFFIHMLAQLDGAAEYTDCDSAEE